LMLRQIVVWVLVISTVVAAPYGLHRLGLWMEGRGWLYYRDRKPGGGARSFVALQEILEPPARHVFHIEDHQRRYYGEGVPGRDEPPGEAEDAESGGEREQPRE
jgi:hypothetical protein